MFDVRVPAGSWNWNNLGKMKEEKGEFTFSELNLFSKFYDAATFSQFINFLKFFERKNRNRDAFV